MVLRKLLTETLMLTSVAALGQIDSAIMDHRSQLPEVTSMAWNNPALEHERYSMSLSSVAASWSHGEKARYGSFSADSYLRKSSMTLTAFAGYDNGKLKNVRACENADAEKIYPYFVYDAAGGDMNMERYRFGGSVEKQLGRRLTLGATLSYEAGLYYRNVDPRPKDITGKLDIALGVSFSVSNRYRIAASGAYEKYKQSCDISFVSELGEMTIYHLTGLGSHYDRFAGTGKSSYYTGHTFSGQLTLMPSASGVYLSAGGGGEMITKILTEFNRLPLNRLKKTDLAAEGGWRGRRWAVIGHGALTIRHGYENIFGDAVAGQYPLIATLGMSSVKVGSYGVKAVKEFNFRKSVISMMFSAANNRYDEKNLASGALMRFSNIQTGINAAVTVCIPRGLIVTAECGYESMYARKGDFFIPEIFDAEVGPFAEVLNEFYKSRSRFGNIVSAEIALLKSISSNRYAVGVTGKYQYHPDSGAASQISVVFKF